MEGGPLTHIPIGIWISGWRETFSYQIKVKLFSTQPPLLPPTEEEHAALVDTPAGIPAGMPLRGNDSESLLSDIMPSTYVDCFEVGDVAQRYAVKSKYKGIAVIYLWFNKLNGRTYVGRSTNLARRLSAYADIFYLNRTKKVMPICGALSLYGHSNFKLYILEVLKSNHQIKTEGPKDRHSV